MKIFNKNGVNYCIRVNSIRNDTKISFYVRAFRYNELPLKEFKKKLHQALKEEFSIEGYKISVLFLNTHVIVIID